MYLGLSTMPPGSGARMPFPRRVFAMQLINGSQVSMQVLWCHALRNSPATGRGRAQSPAFDLT